MSSRKKQGPKEPGEPEEPEEPEESEESEESEEPEEPEEPEEAGLIQLEELSVSVLFFAAFVCYFVCYMTGFFLGLWDHHWFVNSLFFLGALAFVFFVEKPWASFRQKQD